jgi:hypothetical protein
VRSHVEIQLLSSARPLPLVEMRAGYQAERWSSVFGVYSPAQRELNPCLVNDVTTSDALVLRLETSDLELFANGALSYSTAYTQAVRTHRARHSL